MPNAPLSNARPMRPDRPSLLRPPEAITALAGRIRSLQRSEPTIDGDARTDALTELSEIELDLERLSILSWRPDTDRADVLSSTFDLAERVDTLARLWPADVIGTTSFAAVARARLDIEPARDVA